MCNLTGEAFGHLSVFALLLFVPLLLEPEVAGEKKSSPSFPGTQVGI